MHRFMITCFRKVQAYVFSTKSPSFNLTRDRSRRNVGYCSPRVPILAIRLTPESELKVVIL